MREWFRAGVVSLDWRWLSANPPEHIAMELAACAARARLAAAGFGRGRLGVIDESRVQAYGLEEKIAFAEKLPDGKELATIWRQRHAELRNLIASLGGEPPAKL